MNVALVLSSGSARGLAHIGVIEELEAQGHRITSVAGCSMGALVVNISSEAGSIGKCYRTFYLDYGTEKAALNMLTMTLHNYFRDDPNINLICIHPGWIRTNPGNNEAPLIPYEHAETLRELFETRRHDKEGPVFITYEGKSIRGITFRLLYSSLFNIHFVLFCHPVFLRHQAHMTRPLLVHQRHIHIL